ncbi:hypothetical protein [Paracoccus beibuensis]|nr:hypothetical protein [Paracoccus beibuensis]
MDMKSLLIGDVCCRADKRDLAVRKEVLVSTGPLPRLSLALTSQALIQ